MVAFENFQEFEQYSDEIFDLIEDISNPVTISAKDLNAIESGSESRGNSTSINVSLSLEARRYVQSSFCYCDYYKLLFLSRPSMDEHVIHEPIHILIVAIKDNGDKDDVVMSGMFAHFCTKFREELVTRKIRRITFSPLKHKQFPKFFTYR